MNVCKDTKKIRTLMTRLPVAGRDINSADKTDL